MIKKKKENYLERIPRLNRNIFLNYSDSGFITVGIHNTGIINKVFQRIMSKPKICYIHLDEMGSRVISLVDGERNLIKIGEKLDLRTDSSYTCLARFFGLLHSGGVVRWEKK